MHPWRVVIFLDYQNVCFRTRGQFLHSDAPATVGHVDPLKLGRQLFELGCEKYPNRELAGVRVYKGSADHRSGQKVYRSDERRMSSWSQLPGVEVFSRPLTYHPVHRPGRRTGWRPQEKGIDVMLALDVAISARSGTYDVAVVFSSDSDLLPALEDAAVRTRVETAVWGSPGDCVGPLRVKGQSTWSHYLERAHFDLVRDDTDYLASQ